MNPHEFAHELELIYGEDLKSVVLYGSAAGGNHSGKYSDFNVFVVLRDISPASLARSNRAVRKWTGRGNPPPHFFGPEHIESSLDVFPIEFLDMLDRHEVLLGKDPLAGIRVDPKNLRHQCESELKGKLLHLRAFYAGNCHRPRRIAKIMVSSFPTFLALFRAALRLRGEEIPKDSKAVVEKTSQGLGFNPEIFLEVADIRSGNSRLPRGDGALSMFEQYLTGLEQVTRYIDEM